MRLSIAQLRAAGLTDNQILRLVEEAEAERRERERIKKRNQRARPRDGGDGGDTSFLSKEVRKKKKEVKKETTLPDDWQPKGPQRDPTEPDEFRDMCRAKARTYAD